MALAFVMATTAVALGAGLGLAANAGGRVLWLFRSLALIAALVVVFLHLLPDSIEGLGLLPAVGVFGLGLVLPIGLERVFHTQTARGAGKLGLELGFWGLVVHHVGDGLALGAYAVIDGHAGAGHFGGGGGHADVMVALVTHTVPLVAVVSAAYARVEGRRVALWRCAGLAAASVVGIVAATSVEAAWVGAVELWISAAVSGLLLHVVAHDLYAPHVSAT